MVAGGDFAAKVGSSEPLVISYDVKESNWVNIGVSGPKYDPLPGTVTSSPFGPAEARLFRNVTSSSETDQDTYTVRIDNRTLLPGPIAQLRTP